jgi:hypothetical protein
MVSRKDQKMEIHLETNLDCQRVHQKVMNLDFHLDRQKVMNLEM